ncbi:MAG: thiamine pyrophosphate-dependent enzyme, partial [Candidatus Brocadiales bacterium]
YPFVRPRQLVTSGGLGTMGFGLPAAIGAQIGRPDQEVWLISGDGSFLMTNQELATAVAYQVPIRAVIVNNGYLGMVRQWQELFYKKRYSQTHLEDNPDFVRVAEAYGAKGFRVERKEEVRPTLEKALAVRGPVVIDFRIGQEENVFPMIPAGKTVREAIGEGTFGGMA